jgi:hypothetical protein
VRFTSKPNKHYKELQKSVKPGEVLIVPTDDRLLEEETMPYKAGGKQFPDWFRFSPKSGIRKCVGVQDYLSYGFILPAWTNFDFKAVPQHGGWDLKVGQMPFVSMPFESDPFPKETTGSCPMTEIRGIPDSPYPKLVNPFSFITAPGWSLMILGILHEPNGSYDVVPGLVNTDYYHEVNVVLNPHTDQDFTISYGQPLAQLIPIKRDGDTAKLKFGNQNDHKYVFGRGMGGGPGRPDAKGTGRGYRKSKPDTE